MQIEKLLWSKAKTDVLKYLVFKRQGISMRAISNDLQRSYPAIKKQIDHLIEAQILDVDKSQNSRSICIDEDISDLVVKLFTYSLQQDVYDFMKVYSACIDKLFLGKVFGQNAKHDLALIYKANTKELLDQIKKNIDKEVFSNYFIDNVSMISMSAKDFQTRYKLADKFVLDIISKWKKQDIID